MEQRGVLVLLLFAFCWSVYPASTGIKFEHLTLEDGLSQNTVNCILQDRYGFMWFATEDGLNRYDGYNFRIFNSDPNDRRSLGINFVRTIYMDRSGTLWVGTWGGGLNRFDPVSESFIRYHNSPDDSCGLSHNDVTAIVEDDLGLLWVGTRNGLNRFDPQTGTFTRYFHEPGQINSLGHNEITSLCKDRSGSIWIGTLGGVNKYDSQREVFIKYPQDQSTILGSHRREVTALAEDSSGNILIGTRGSGLGVLDPHSGTIIYFTHDSKNPNSISHDVISAIYIDSTDNTWVGTDSGGLNRFDLKTRHFSHFINQPLDSNSISNNEVRAIYEDLSGVLWVSTYGGGLNKRNRQKERFLLYGADPSQPNNKKNFMVWSIYQDLEGILWIGTGGGGLNRYDREKNQLSYFRHNPNDPNSLSGNYVRVIQEDRDGYLWIGTNSGGINRFDRKTGRCKRFLHVDGDPSSLSHNLVRSIYQDAAGVIWVGTGKGLNKYHPETGHFTLYSHIAGDPSSLSHDYVYSILEDSRGTMWVGTWGGGLNIFDREKEQFACFRNNIDDHRSLSNDLVLTIHEDPLGAIWLGTSGGGLNHFDRETGTFIHYRMEDGLPNDVIYGILEDTHGHLWLSTNKGLSDFDPLSKKFQNYSVVDGLQSNEFNGGAYFKSRKGEMFFGGINGFNSFFPEKIMDGNTYVPPVVITAFLKSNKRVKLEKPISQLDEIRLSHWDNSFSFEFAALDYNAPERNKYAYKMDKLDDQYIFTDAKKRFASYTTLAPGNYVFRVRGSNNDGKWNKEGTAIRVIISQPLWQTFWVRLLAIFILAGLVYVYVRFQLKKVRLEVKKESLEKELETKTDFTAMLVHDLRSPLASVLGYAQMMTRSPDKIDVIRAGTIISKSSEKMLTIINDMLVISKFEAGKITLNKNPVTLTSILEEAVEVLRPLFDMKKLELKYKLTQLPPLLLDGEKISQVLVNLLSNAVKFSPEKATITVSLQMIQENGGYFQELAVKDVGQGVTPEMRKFLFDKYAQLHNDTGNSGTGLGLAVSRLIIEAHDGKIGYQPRESKGSEFYFRLAQPQETRTGD